MMDTFTTGMQGRPIRWEEQTQLLGWLDGVRPTRVARPGPDHLLGEALFHDPQVGCARCHSGLAFTDNRLWDVRPYDGEGPIKTPSLLGVGARSPLLHDGCAETLEDRFLGELACTGEREHGDTSSLEPRELEALIAYLRTL
jgi:cytochrome c peroxidase